MPLKWTQMNVSKLVAGRMEVWRIRIWMAGCNGAPLSDAASHYWASVFCSIQGYTASPVQPPSSPTAPRALLVLPAPLGPWNGRHRKSFLEGNLQFRHSGSQNAYFLKVFLKKTCLLLEVPKWLPATLLCSGYGGSCPSFGHLCISI